MLDVAEQQDNEEPEGSEGTKAEAENVEENEKQEEPVFIDDDTIDNITEDDIDDDDDDYEDEEDEDEDSPQSILQHKQAEIEALKTRLLRAHADMENFKRRSDRDKQDSIKFANKNIFLQLLDVLDNFDRAFTAAPDPKDNFVIGVNMIYKQLCDVLLQNGVEEINAEGRLFDPYLDEALAKEATTEHEDSMVIEVFQRGFRFNGTLLRPSKVKVAVAPTPESEEASTDDDETFDSQESNESTTE